MIWKMCIRSTKPTVHGSSHYSKNTRKDGKASSNVSSFPPVSLLFLCLSLSVSLSLSLSFCILSFCLSVSREQDGRCCTHAFGAREHGQCRNTGMQLWRAVEIKSVPLLSSPLLSSSCVGFMALHRRRRLSLAKPRAESPSSPHHRRCVCGRGRQVSEHVKTQVKKKNERKKGREKERKKKKKHLRTSITSWSHAQSDYASLWHFCVKVTRCYR